MDQKSQELKPEALPIIRSGLDMKRKSLEIGIKRYRSRLTDFEARFAVTSHDFNRRFNNGELGDDAAWPEGVRYDFEIGMI